MDNQNRKWVTMVLIILAIGIISITAYMLSSDTDANEDALSNKQANQATEVASEEKSEATTTTQVQSTADFATANKEALSKTPLHLSVVNGGRINFEGTITVSGKYQEISPANFLGGWLCFYPDEKTGMLIPRGLTDQENGIDNRTPWFCFENQEESKQLLGIGDETAIFNNESINCIEGTATIEISNYTVVQSQKEAWDTATLDKVLSKGKYATKCSWEN